MRKFAAIVMSLVLAFGLVGCHPKVDPNKVPEAPAIVFERTVLGAADATVVVASALTALDQTRKTLEATGQISAQTSESIKQFNKLVAARNEAAVQAIKIAELSGDINATNWRTLMLQTMYEIQKVDPALYGVKNKDAEASLRLALASLTSIAQIINMSFGGK